MNLSREVGNKIPKDVWRNFLVKLRGTLAEVGGNFRKLKSNFLWEPGKIFAGSLGKHLKISSWIKIFRRAFGRSREKFKAEVEKNVPGSGKPKNKIKGFGKVRRTCQERSEQLPGSSRNH